MQNITIIIGLPGSGKTTYIKSNSEKFKKATICDDYYKSSYKHSHIFEDSIYYEDLKNALLNDKDAVLADIAWCKTERLEILKEDIKNIIEKLKIDVKITFLYFENNPISCKKNILKRGRKERIEREIEFVDKVSNQYIIPKDVITIPVVC